MSKSEDDLVMMPHYVLIVYDKLLNPRKAGKDSGNPSPTVSLAEKSLERTKNAEIVATTLKANELNRDLHTRSCASSQLAVVC